MAARALRAVLNQTMLRVKDPKVTIPFYQKWFDMTLIERKDFSDFSLYFLVTLPTGHKAPTPGTDEANAYLKRGEYGVTLELTHNHGTESDPKFAYHNGNTDPRGFGHIGFLVDDLDSHCQKMVDEGVPFKKLPQDGKMRGLAFAVDPDGYWVEIIQRSPGAALQGRPSFQQSMIRVKNGKESVKYYTEMFDMTLLAHLDFPDMKFSLDFLASVPEDQRASLPEPNTPEAFAYVNGMSGTALELTYNYGTDTDPEFPGYHNGNKEPRGFGHIAFQVDDVYAMCEKLEEKGVKFQKKPDEGRMKGLAFALDPDGYWIEIIKRQA